MVSLALDLDAFVLVLAFMVLGVFSSEMDVRVMSFVVVFWIVAVLVSVTVMLFARHVHDVYRDSLAQMLVELGIGPLEIDFKPPP